MEDQRNDIIDYFKEYLMMVLDQLIPIYVKVKFYIFKQNCT